MSKKRIWVCPACGKTAEDRYQFNDVSCFINAMLCRPVKNKPEPYAWVGIKEQNARTVLEANEHKKSRETT